MSALALSPDTSAKSIICLDRKYNFLDKDNYVYMVSGGEHVALIRDDASLWMFGSNLDGKSGIASPFTDTTDADVIAMYRLGIVNGTSRTTFAPDRNITREEAAKIMCGLAATLGDETAAPAAVFPDNGEVSAWARDSVGFVSHRGIMKGKTNGFDPKNAISIQESILICYRYLGTVLE